MHPSILPLLICCIISGVKMNYARGLSRIYIVLSVIWVFYAVRSTAEHHEQQRVRQWEERYDTCLHRERRDEQWTCEFLKIGRPTGNLSTEDFLTHASGAEILDLALVCIGLPALVYLGLAIAWTYGQSLVAWIVEGFQPRAHR